MNYIYFPIIAGFVALLPAALQAGEGLELTGGNAESAATKSEPEEKIIRFSMSDIREDEHADAERLVSGLNRLGERLRPASEEVRGTVAYAEDWEKWRALKDRAEGHSMYEDVIEPRLESEPPYPKPEALEASRRLQREDRREEIARRQETKAAERAEEAARLQAELARHETREKLREERLEETRRLIRVFNQRTSFRSSGTIQRRISIGRDPFPDNLSGAYRKARVVP